MTGHQKWAIIRERLRDDPAANERYEALRRATEDAVRLGQLRETRDMTQAQVAQALGSSQANVSKLERRGDLYLSTLTEYVEALGGRLELRAIFPDQVVTINVAPIDERASASARPPGGGLT